LPSNATLNRSEWLSLKKAAPIGRIYGVSVGVRCRELDLCQSGLTAVVAVNFK